MDFLTFLSDYEKEDVSEVKSVFESNKAKEDVIINEAFKSEFPTKKEALFNLNNYFIEEATAPKSVDVSYVKENIEDLRSKIEQLDEGDIRIIIHNHEAKKDSGVGFEEESTKPKKKRGRPKKDDFTKAPAMTGVVYDEPELDNISGDGGALDGGIVADDNITPIDDEIVAKAELEAPKDDLPLPTPDEEDVVADVDVVDDEPIADEKILTDVLPEEEDEEEENPLITQGKPSKLRWSDIVAKVDSQEQERDGLVDKLAELDLDEEELRQATAMAESGEIVEDDSKVSSAASLINQINKL